MRMDSLPTPGILGNAYPLMREMVKAISQIEVAAGFNGGKATEAAKLSDFITAARASIDDYLPVTDPVMVPVTVLEATTSPAMTGNSTTEVYTSNPQGGVARVGSFVVGTEAIFELQHPNTTDSGAMLAFDVAAGLPTTAPTQDYIAQIIPSGAVYQSANSSNSMVSPNFTLVAAPTARMRLRCTVAGQVYIETQNDDTSPWVIRHTFPVLATVGATLHARMYCTWSASQRRIYQPRVSGIS